MMIMFRTRNGTQRLEWAHYALLRDNVQHYLESGPGHTCFTALHSVERAVDGDVRYVRALDLRREVQRAWGALANLPLAESAVSLRTRALLAGEGVTPFVKGTFSAKATGWPLPVTGDESRPLRAYIGDFVETLLLLTDLVSPLDGMCVARADLDAPTGSS